MKTMCGCCALVMLLLGAVVLPAEQTRRPQAALIIYTAGADIVIRDAGGGKISATDLIRHPLLVGDTLTTGDNSLVEIQLNRSVISIAENTAFRIERLEQKREVVFQVLYGSVRARVRKLAKGGAFSILGGDAVVAVRGADFGLNVLIDRAQEDADPVTEVFCFAAEVKVEPLFAFPDRPLPGAGKEGLILQAGEMVRLSRRDPEAAGNKLPIEDRIKRYWQDNGFQGRLLSGQALRRQEPELYKLEQSRRKLTMAASSLLTAGLLLEFGGAISLAAGTNSDISDPVRRESLKNSGIALLSGGSFFLTSSLVAFLRSASHERRIEKAGTAAPR